MSANPLWGCSCRGVCSCGGANANPMVWMQQMLQLMQCVGGNVVPGLRGPIAGVADGSNAQAGQVGEYVQFEVTGTPYPINTFSIPITLGTLQPGDWDTWMLGSFSNDVFDMNIVMPNQISTWYGDFSDTILGKWGWDFNSPHVRANLTVPATIAFLVGGNVSGNAPAAGTIDLQFRARRMR